MTVMSNGLPGPNSSLCRITSFLQFPPEQPPVKMLSKLHRMAH